MRTKICVSRCIHHSFLEQWFDRYSIYFQYLSFSLSLLIFSRQALDFGPDEDGSSLPLHRTKYLYYNRAKHKEIPCAK